MDETVLLGLGPSEDSPFGRMRCARSRVALHYPRFKPLELSDPEFSYALRRTLLSNFDNLVSPGGSCFGCGKPDHATHFLACSANSRQSIATKRHTAIKLALAWYMKDSGREVVMERVVGEGTIADIIACINGVDDAIDVKVTALPAPRVHPMPLPLPHEVLEQLSTPSVVRHPQFQHFWEDTCDDAIHPLSKQLRTYRKLATDMVVHHHTRKEENAKRARYARVDVNVRPFVLTAEGGVGPSARGIIDDLTELAPGGPAEKSLFRKRLLGRLSILLLRYAHQMTADACGSSRAHRR